jgi:hypothetical protein
VNEQPAAKELIGNSLGFRKPLQQEDPEAQNRQMYQTHSWLETGHIKRDKNQDKAGENQ